MLNKPRPNPTLYINSLILNAYNSLLLYSRICYLKQILFISNVSVNNSEWGWGSMVVQQIALWSHTSTNHNVVLSLNYCLCIVSQVLLMSLKVFSKFSGSSHLWLDDTKLAPGLNEWVCTWCFAMDRHFIQDVLPPLCPKYFRDPLQPLLG